MSVEYKEVHNEIDASKVWMTSAGPNRKESKTIGTHFFVVNYSRKPQKSLMRFKKNNAITIIQQLLLLDADGGGYYITTQQYVEVLQSKKLNPKSNLKCKIL